MVCLPRIPALLPLVALLGACGAAGPAKDAPTEAAVAKGKGGGVAAAAAKPRSEPAAEEARPGAAVTKAPAAKKVAPDTGPAVGEPAPDFAVRDDTGATVRLADHRGKRPVLLAFYPKDFTGGCTAELTEFGAKHSVFTGAGVQVYGVSIDPPEKHHGFRQSLNLPFPLLADEDGAVSRAYGALADRGGQMFSLRKIVLVDRDGKIAYRDEAYKVGDPAAFDAIQAAIQALGQPEPQAAGG